MSSDVWKIGQKIDANDYYKNAYDNGLGGNPFIRGEVGAMISMTNICCEMIQAYDEVIEDQNEYLVEIDEFNEQIDKKIQEKDEKIQAYKKRIKELEIKDATGELTEEEKEEFKTETSELFTLTSDSSNEIKGLCNNFNSKSESRQSEFKSKEEAAEKYGSLTVEKAKPLADTHVSGGFFKKLFGTTGKNKKRAGENGLKAGNELLDKVKDSNDVDKEISKIVKHSTNKK